MGEFWDALRSHQEEKDADRRHIGELVRGATLRLFNLQVQKKDRYTDPAKFWPMPWDPDDESKAEDLYELVHATPEQRAALAADFLKKINKTPEHHEP